jgi:hypothetical protein
MLADRKLTDFVQQLYVPCETQRTSNVDREQNAPTRKGRAVLRGGPADPFFRTYPSVDATICLAGSDRTMSKGFLRHNLQCPRSSKRNGPRSR